LQYYYPVGGVRIEDDILVTEDGYENLTKAPKGQAALDIINRSEEKPVEVKKKKGWFW
jgi:Xaa-Pro dipeptidase